MQFASSVFRDRLRPTIRLYASIHTRRTSIAVAPPRIIRRIAYWILFVIFIDISFNLMPALKDAHGDPQPFLSINLLWTIASVAGVGGIVVWAYLRSFATADAKLIPIRDPRITECLTHHE